MITRRMLGKNASEKTMLWLFSALILLGAVSCSKNEITGEKTSFAREGAAPDFSLRDTAGNMVALSRYRGKAVLLEFWATWCPPCKATIPELISLQNKYSGKGLVVIGVSMDEGNDLGARLSAFSKEHNINYPVLLADEDVVKSYHISSIPMTFIIDKDGRFVTSYMGYVDGLGSVVSEQLNKIL